MKAQQLISQVKKGMHVYDSTDNNFGNVQYVYTPDAELEEAMLRQILAI